MRVVRFGDNMRDVAVTDGDKVEAQVQLGFSVDGHGVGDLVAASSAAPPEIVEALLTDYADQYELAAELRPGGARRDSLVAAARIEAGLRAFLDEHGSHAFTDTFEDLHGMPQLPGIAAQRLMDASTTSSSPSTFACTICSVAAAAMSCDPSEIYASQRAANRGAGTALPLGGAAEEAALERPLRGDEHDRDGKGGDQRRERNPGSRRPEDVRQPDLDRKLPLVREEDVGQEEVVPVGDEAEEEDEGDDRLRERKRYAQERLKVAAAVDARRIQQAPLEPRSRSRCRRERRRTGKTRTAG